MKNIYPAYQSIRGNCDTMVFLGANDNETAEYISKSLGDQTIETASQSQKMSEVFDGSNSRSTSARKLMALDEVLRLGNDEEIVILRGQFPAKLRKYDYTLHPAAKEMRGIRIEEWQFPVREEVEYLAPPPEGNSVKLKVEDVDVPPPSAFFGEDF